MNIDLEHVEPTQHNVQSRDSAFVDLSSYEAWMKNEHCCDLEQVEPTQDDVQRCSDWISDSMNRTGNHICRACEDGQTES